MKPPPPPLHTHPPFTGDSERDLPGGLDGKASAYNLGDLGSIPGSGRSPGEGNGNPLQYSCLENPMGGGAWWATVHGVKKSRTRLSDFTHSLTHSLTHSQRGISSRSQSHTTRTRRKLEAPWAGQDLLFASVVLPPAMSLKAQMFTTLTSGRMRHLWAGPAVHVRCL